MSWLLATAGLVLALMLVALFVRVTVHLSVQGRGDPSGSWALAGGAQVGPLTVAAHGGRGAEPGLAVLLFSRRLLSRPLLSHRSREPEEPERASWRERYRRLERWIDPVELLVFVLGERSRVEVPGLEVELEYSFEDVALTGKMMGAIYMLDSLLPAPLVLRQTVGWEFEDRAAMNGSGMLAFRPGLVLFDVCVFLFRHIRLRRPIPVAQPTGS